MAREQPRPGAEECLATQLKRARGNHAQREGRGVGERMVEGEIRQNRGMIGRDLFEEDEMEQDIARPQHREEQCELGDGTHGEEEGASDAAAIESDDVQMRRESQVARA